MTFEIRAKDLAGRIGVLETPRGTVETPTVMPVVDLARQPVASRELKAIGAEMLIANAYLLWKNRRSEAIEKGVHKLLDWDGPVMTDSGAYQLMQYGQVDVTNEEIIEFQKAVNVDAGVILDIPGVVDKRRAKANVMETVRRARELKKDGRLWVGPVQGSTFPDLRRYACEQMRRFDFDVYAIGSVVPLMNAYKFAENIDIIAACKQALPLNRPVHHFGGGHPMFFAFAVAMGVDLFDSAAYSLFARKGKYMTPSGTYEAESLRYLPCSCPVCSSHDPQQLTEDLLARHNLHATFEEIRRVKQAIAEGSLWELLEERARAHPRMWLAFQRMARHMKYIEELDTSTKRRFLVQSELSSQRPEVLRHAARMRKPMKSKKLVALPLFKKVPVELLEAFPFGPLVLPEERKLMKLPRVNDVQKLNALAEYQFCVPSLFKRGVKVEKSKNTEKIRAVTDGNALLATVRASDYVLVPHEAARAIHKKTRSWRVVVSPDTAAFPREGRNVFAKFVKKADHAIRAGMEVLVVDERDELLATGTAALSGREMEEFDRGVAVVTRKGFGQA
jgi:7-cyano-7-deazaguanine tRNA-ribosyltransferase